MSAEEIALAIGGRKVGGTWMACCPVHDDRTPSLSNNSGNDGKVLVYCHAGCDQRDVIAVLRRCGLWETTPKFWNGFARKRQDRVSDEPDANARKRSEAALAIWQASQPADGTAVAAYVNSRGLILSDSSDLRFHPGLKHPSGAIWPAMVALVTDGAEGALLAVLRTYLVRNGAGKAPVNPAKMMLGQCRGGVVRLAHPDSLLMIGEGIETCLSAMQATGHPAWAALSTSGLRSLDLPRDVREVIALADGDEPGEAAAEDCARRWKHEGRRVRIARPPTGTDFNDMLMAFRADIALANAGPAKGAASARVTAAPQTDQATGSNLPWR